MHVSVPLQGILPLGSWPPGPINRKGHQQQVGAGRRRYLPRRPPPAQTGWYPVKHASSVPKKGAGSQKALQPHLLPARSSRGGPTAAKLQNWQPGPSSRLFFFFKPTFSKPGKRRVTKDANWSGGVSRQARGCRASSLGRPRDLRCPRRYPRWAQSAARALGKAAPSRAAASASASPAAAAATGQCAASFRPGLGRGGRIGARAFRPQPPTSTPCAPRRPHTGGFPLGSSRLGYFHITI